MLFPKVIRAGKRGISRDREAGEGEQTDLANSVKVRDAINESRNARKTPGISWEWVEH